MDRHQIIKKLYMLIHTNIRFLSKFNPDSLKINQDNEYLITPLSSRSDKLYKYINRLLVGKKYLTRDFAGYVWT